MYLQPLCDAYDSLHTIIQFGNQLIMRSNLLLYDEHLSVQAYRYQHSLLFQIDIDKFTKHNLLNSFSKAPLSIHIYSSVISSCLPLALSIRFDIIVHSMTTTFPECLIVLSGTQIRLACSVQDCVGARRLSISYPISASRYLEETLETSHAKSMKTLLPSTLVLWDIISCLFNCVLVWGLVE